MANFDSQLLFQVHSKDYLDKLDFAPRRVDVLEIDVLDVCLYPRHFRSVFRGSNGTMP